jgi:hypothetical protein
LKKYPPGIEISASYSCPGTSAKTISNPLTKKFIGWFHLVIAPKIPLTLTLSHKGRGDYFKLPLDRTPSLAPLL